MTDTDIDVRVRERFASLPAGPSADVEAALQEVNRRLRRHRAPSRCSTGERRACPRASGAGRARDAHGRRRQRPVGRDRAAAVTFWSASRTAHHRIAGGTPHCRSVDRQHVSHRARPELQHLPDRARRRQAVHRAERETVLLRTWRWNPPRYRHGGCRTFLPRPIMRCSSRWQATSSNRALDGTTIGGPWTLPDGYQLTEQPHAVSSGLIITNKDALIGDLAWCVTRQPARSTTSAGTTSSSTSTLMPTATTRTRRGPSPQPTPSPCSLVISDLDGSDRRTIEPPRLWQRLLPGRGLLSRWHNLGHHDLDASRHHQP